MDKTVKYVLMLLPIISFGIAIGISQHTIQSHSKSIERLIELTDGLDVLQENVKLISKRLNRIEYGKEELAAISNPGLSVASK